MPLRRLTVGRDFTVVTRHAALGDNGHGFVQA